jgi:hypothetical protein
MKRSNLILTFLILVTLGLAATRIVVSNAMTTSGLTLDRVKQDLSFYKTQNEVLEEKYLVLSSLTFIASEAARLGFTEDKANLVLTNPKTANVLR